jgi:hypothetical protein
MQLCIHVFSLLKLEVKESAFFKSTSYKHQQAQLLKI